VINLKDVGLNFIILSPFIFYMEFIALFIAIFTYLMIALRSITKIPPWASMFFGGVLMIVTGVISVDQAYSSINLDVIIFLITIFTFSSALEISGFLRYLAYKLVMKYRQPRKIIFLYFSTQVSFLTL